MAQYQFTYNGYTFPFAKLQTTMAVEYAEDRATQIGTAYDITISGVITAATEMAMANLVNGIRGALQVPRQTLTIQWSPDGSSWQQFYQFNPAPTDDTGDTTNVDVRWGPLPDNLELHQFTGGKAAIYTWRCRVAVKDCVSGSGATCTLGGRQDVSGNVLALTANWQFTVDNDGKTTATVSGVLVISSNAQAAGITPDNFRYYVTPNLPSFFQRQSASYHTSVDGLSMTYSITDKEMTHTLPAPITGGQANWKVSVSDMGAKVEYSLSGWYSSPPQIPKSQIINRIGELISVKFPISNSAVALIWDELELDEEVFENKISFHVRAHGAAGALTGGSAPVFNFTGILNTIDVQVKDSNSTAYLPSPYGGDGINGDSGVIALPVQIWNPCVAYNNKPINAAQGSLNPYGAAPNGGNGSDKGNQQDYPPGDTTQAHQTAPFIAYHEVVSYYIDNHISTFVPKKKGAVPFLQQTGIPTMTVIQAGYAVRDSAQDTMFDNQPIPGAPILELTGDAPSGIMLENYISPVNPEPLGNQGFVRMSIRWRYVMRVIASIEDNLDSVNLFYPDDPRLVPTAPPINLPNSGANEIMLVVKPD